MSNNTIVTQASTSLKQVDLGTANQRIITLSSGHHWHAKTVFQLYESAGAIDRILYTKDANDTVECDFSNFVAHAQVFFEFFGVPQDIQADNGEGIISILRRVMEKKIPTTYMYDTHPCCGCKKPYCAALVGYERFELTTIGDFLRLVGCPDEHLPQFKFTYPDSVYLHLQHIDGPLKILEKSCLSGREARNIAVEERAYSYSYGR